MQESKEPDKKPEQIQTPEQEKEMTLMELKNLICGTMEFTFEIGGGVEITLKELNQKELMDIDSKLQERGLKPDLSSTEYMSNMRVLKLVTAFKGISYNSKKITIDAPIEKLLWELGEGTITGLYFKYEGVVSDKFNSVQKKN